MVSGEGVSKCSDVNRTEIQIVSERRVEAKWLSTKSLLATCTEHSVKAI